MLLDNQQIVYQIDAFDLSHSRGSYGQASVHVEAVARHVSGRGVGGQEPHQTRHLLGGAAPAQRDVGDDGVLVELFGHVALDEPRAHRVDTHIAAAELLGQGLGHADHPALGSGVVGLSGIADLSHNGRDVNNSTTLLCHHRSGERSLCTEEHSIEIHIDHVSEIFLSHNHYQHISSDACIVHQNIHWANLIKFMIVDFAKIRNVWILPLH